jgi:hypothetical protein
MLTRQPAACPWPRAALESRARSREITDADINAAVIGIPLVSFFGATLVKNLSHEFDD